MSSYQVLVARVDCFSETPVSTYGKLLRQQVEGIMECFTSETVRKKNIDDMKEAEEAALEVKEKAIKKKKKASGTAKRLAEEIAAGQLKPRFTRMFRSQKKKRKRTRPEMDNFHKTSNSNSKSEFHSLNINFNQVIFPLSIHFFRNLYPISLFTITIDLFCIDFM
ncbi:unnamed protein product [Caenorhabditis nigoni]